MELGITVNGCEITGSDSSRTEVILSQEAVKSQLHGADLRNFCQSRGVRC